MFLRMIALASAIIGSALDINDAGAAEKRVALVIGNSAYVHSAPLTNPRNDGEDMAAAPESLNFQVVKGFDLDKPSMDRTIRAFATALSGAKVGLFYYAGHGIQVSGQNYLIPIDAELSTAAGLDFETVRMDLVHRIMEQEARTNIIFLDACRNNPLSRNLARALGTRSVSISRGLASIESGEGTLISFSTQPGNVALDGKGRNSPYTAALVKHIRTPGNDLPSILINVRNDVIQSTGRQQVPWEHSAMTARFFFTEPAGAAELELWQSVRKSMDPKVIGTYLDKYPNGDYATAAQTLVTSIEEHAKALASVRPPPVEQKTAPRQAAQPAQKASAPPSSTGGKDLPRESETKVLAALPIPPTVAPPPARSLGGSFDGAWKIVRVGTNCRNPSFVFNINIDNGAMRGRAGSVSPSGAVNFTARTESGKPNHFKGAFSGNSGSGTFAVPGGKCHGTFTAKRLTSR